ncbi:YciI family protein [Inquilinus sp. Marseille-Q2685]|uniref:YciI family protein n=1 Tax=Inquilinus sp. Marseille-Q2685 TaxID=2866581 RepID=UPI001CE49C73|nr:YciI family protein [Inquilinus sp. Marseille-Q2685]
MLYAVLCYHNEAVTEAWSKAEDDAVMTRLAAVQEPLARQGKIGPVARLLPTTAAATLRLGAGGEALVIDGPFAETKEQLLGFYTFDCASLDEVLDIVRDLARANPGGAYEIRPIRIFKPGTAGS